MYRLSDAQQTLASVDLTQGLNTSEVHAHLHRGLRLNETGQRILAFYLNEMADRRLYQSSGHNSAAHFAEDRLGLDPRRARELIVVGRTLLTLPSLDGAFCEQRIGWSKVLLLARVAVPQHEDAWLERALALNVRDLALEVKRSKAGAAPRRPGEHKGLPDVRFTIGASVDALTFQKVELAKQKLGAERGRPVTDAEWAAHSADLILGTDADGNAPGRTRVDASLYRVVLRPVDEGHLAVETESGPIPIEGGACLRCDAESVHADGTRAHKTPAPMRRRVLARDAGRCRCCGSRQGLMVHHIVFRSQGGRTAARNLITLCTPCHALVHADLLVLAGQDADHIRFRDAQDNPLHEPEALVPESALLPLSRPRRDTEQAPAAPVPAPAPAPIGVDTLPDVVDGSWWRRHAHLIRARRDQGLVLRSGTPLIAGSVGNGDIGGIAGGASTPSRPPPDPDAFAAIHGQGERVERLAATAEGCLARGKPFPHALFVGAPGTGKTTLAKAVAASCGARLIEISGPLMQDSHALISVLAELDDDDFLFIDEVHAVPRSVLETLYQAMAERHVTLTLHAKGRAHALRLDLPDFTLLGATTEDGELPHALRSRFGLLEQVGYYAASDLATLVSQVARRDGVRLGERAALRLARHARGTPREALRLLERVLDEAARKRRTFADLETVDATLRRLGFDRDGLAPAEQQYLAVLRASSTPVPLSRLARMLGHSARTVVEHVEPFLFRQGLVRMTAQGRIAMRSPRLLAQ